ncbi:hypothetical protein X801_00147, partial [Opisthorchis viverrini]
QSLDKFGVTHCRKIIAASCSLCTTLFLPFKCLPLAQPLHRLPFTFWWTMSPLVFPHHVSHLPRGSDSVANRKDCLFGEIRCFPASMHLLRELARCSRYFIADSVHMFWWSRERSTFELLVHHFAVMTCFTSAVVSGTYIGYAVVALLVEINSIFLHMRRLLKCLEFPKDSLFSQFVNYANLGEPHSAHFYHCFRLFLGCDLWVFNLRLIQVLSHSLSRTFIVFRFLVLCWMTRWLVLNRDQISLPYYCLGTTCLALIMFMNIVLFMRLVQSDVLSRDSAVGAATLVASTHVTTNSTSAFKRKTVHQSHDSQSVSLCASD